MIRQQGCFESKRPAFCTWPLAVQCKAKSFTCKIRRDVSIPPQKDINIGVAPSISDFPFNSTAYSTTPYTSHILHCEYRIATMSFGFPVEDILASWRFVQNLFKLCTEIKQELLLLELLPPLLPEQIIRERLLRFLEHLALLLLKIIQFLLSYIRSAGFMNRRRPKCTTMPWEIWPSLVVLWGVCWMFYPPALCQNGNQRQPPLEDEQLPYFSDGIQSL